MPAEKELAYCTEKGKALKCEKFPNDNESGCLKEIKIPSQN